MTYTIVHKPTFTNQLLALPPKEITRVIEKARILESDPAPHGDLKKKLHHTKGNVYRLRQGDYRIVYTYGPDWVSLMGVDDRKDVYRGGVLVADPVDVDLSHVPEWEDLFGPEAQRLDTSKGRQRSERLPRPITAEMLRRLRIPEIYHERLLHCSTDDDLTTVEIPDQFRDRVWDSVTAPDFDQVLQQPDYLTESWDDLLRYVEGDLLGFLLKLDPDQERLVEWGVEGSGPILLKGGPGTGKSMIALYRARALIRSLKNDGVAQPRILFTTYTSALIATSEQLLRKLLGDDDACVEVRTADSVATEIVRSIDGTVNVAAHNEVAAALRAAMDGAEFEGNELAKAAQKRTVERLSTQYLEDEFGRVIEARELNDAEEYLRAPRPGRAVALNRMQRQAVWSIYETFREQLRLRKRMTWEQVRRRAAGLLREGRWSRQYDAVIVDEAQDLDPTLIRVLASLSQSPNRIFITADANQSIYGGSFRWADVHEDLKFTGHARILRINYRSTGEIGRAAHSYLGGSTLETPDPPEYVKDGPLPVVRAVPDAFAEGELLVRFLPAAAREFRLGIGACAVLCPTKDAATGIAGRLKYDGVAAEFMSGGNVDLSSPAVKVLTLNAAKGLEFPVVALAGFVQSPNPGLRSDWSEEERDEWLRRERRTVFVGMTRAMRALLVLAPASGSSQLFGEFSPELWNLAGSAA